MKLSKICDELEKIAPTNTCLSFDNVGLLVGNKDKDVKSILVSLDLTMEVLDEAIEKNVDLIVSHHPLIFSPLKKITSDTVCGNILIKLIKNGIAYYASHTNLDKSVEGTNYYLANQLKLENFSFVEDENLILVTGQKKTTSFELVEEVKKVLDLDFVRFVGENKEVKKIGIATGSGDSYNLFSACKKENVDILITGDLTYHTMQFAKDINLSLIDATHFKTENIVINHLKKLFDERLENVTTFTSTVQKNIFTTL